MKITLTILCILRIQFACKELVISLCSKQYVKSQWRASFSVSNQGRYSFLMGTNCEKPISRKKSMQTELKYEFYILQMSMYLNVCKF